MRFRLENLISNVKNIRSRKELIDVTLIGDDGVQIGAHMIMLSACSSFFRNIWVNMNHKHPFLYLRGMQSLNITAVLDFIYHGEVHVLQEHLQHFLDMAEDLGIQGLSNLKPVVLGQNKIKKTTVKQKEETEKEDQVLAISDDNQVPDPLVVDQADLSGLIDDFVSQYQIPTTTKSIKYEALSMEEIDHQGALQVDPYYHHEEVVPNQDFFREGNDALSQAIDKEIEELIQPVGSHYGCKKCGKVMRKKQHIKNHAESHLVGYSHPCPFCEKYSKTRNALQNHISYFHKKPFPENMLMI